MPSLYWSQGSGSSREWWSLSHPCAGVTSVGKTSLITYLANITGNKVVRVNSHEHTDIQEYIGFYNS